MIDDGEYLNEVTKLCKLYYERWGKEVDFFGSACRYKLSANP